MFSIRHLMANFDKILKFWLISEILAKFCNCCKILKFLWNFEILAKYWYFNKIIKLLVHLKIALNSLSSVKKHDLIQQLLILWEDKRLFINMKISKSRRDTEILTKVMKFWQNYEILSKFWTFDKILKFCWNSEIWQKF